VEVINGYLLDTNIISILARPNDSRHTVITAHLQAALPGPIMLPVIAIAEIEFGMAKANGFDEHQRAALRSFFARYPLHLGIDDNTIEPYSLIRAQLWRQHGTLGKRGRGHKEKRPEELFDRVTGKELGIDERDLFIASVAAQYGLILATNDQNPGMKQIEEAARKLEEGGKPVRLRIDYWPRSS
jgi:predicted nucleic acid-binding protein